MLDRGCPRMFSGSICSPWQKLSQRKLVVEGEKGREGRVDGKGERGEGEGKGRGSVR